MDCQPEPRREEPVLECEKIWIFALLIAAGGYLGAFTYSLRGGVFCNAQTANVVLLSMALGNGQWSRALYYLIPISAYILGAVISELLPNRVKRLHFLRWDTMLVGIELITVLLLTCYVPTRNNGQTIGERLMHLRVVNKNGKPRTWWQSLLRECILKVSCAPLFVLFSVVYYVVYLLIMQRDPKGELAHDLLLKTSVVEA